MVWQIILLYRFYAVILHIFFTYLMLMLIRNHIALSAQIFPNYQIPANSNSDIPFYYQKVIISNIGQPVQTEKLDILI